MQKAERAVPPTEPRKSKSRRRKPDKADGQLSYVGQEKGKSLRYSGLESAEGGGAPLPRSRGQVVLLRFLCHLQKLGKVKA